MRFLLLGLVAACSHPHEPTLMERLSGPLEPFRVVGNVYDVGASNIASYAIVTPAGIILIDTLTPELNDRLLANFEKVGLHARDVKIVLCSHAHFDHVGGHAAIVRASRAKVMVMHEDAEAVHTGKDLSPLADDTRWTPVTIDRELADGDTVELGGQTLTAIKAPGHTPGCTVWRTTIHDDRDYDVVFYGCSRPNDSVKLHGNPKFPTLIADTEAAFAKMRALSPDIFLTMHPEDEFAPVIDKLRAGVKPNPLADKAAWPKQLDEVEADFRAALAKER